MRKGFSIPSMILMALLLVSCGTKQQVVRDDQTGRVSVSSEKDALAAKKLSFVQKVADNAVTVRNISSKITFNVKAGDKDITVPGRIRMHKDDVIRIQLFIPILGTEVGRLEFTKDDVLVIDRIHKEYVRGDYNQIDFLQENGLSFYSLQSLFWNQLFLPNTPNIHPADLIQFDVNLDETAQNLPVTFQQGKMSYLWNADQQTGRITNAKVTYDSPQHGTSVFNVDYSNFKNVSGKPYPNIQRMSFSTSATKSARQVEMNIEMSGVTTEGEWETRTTVSDKYKKVEAKDVLGKIMSL